MADVLGLDDELLAQLDNPVWAGSTTAQRDLVASSDDGLATRYPRRMSPFGAIVTGDETAWAALAALVGDEGAAVFMRADKVEGGVGWERIFSGRGTQYVCTDPPPIGRASLGATELGPADVPEMLDLTAATKPGPFVPRTHEMGRYVGIRQQGRLVAMAGERIRSDRFTEISAVCVDPIARRQGLAAALTVLLAHSVKEQGLLPMLHVAGDNDAAHAVYRGIGFEPRSELRFTAWRYHAS